MMLKTENLSEAETASKPSWQANPKNFQDKMLTRVIVVILYKNFCKDLEKL